MPTYILKLSDGSNDFYLEWSTIVDAPITNGMSRQEFIEYYLDNYDKSSKGELLERLKRVDTYGTSSVRPTSAKELTRGNRAGDGETNLSLTELIDKYCR